MTAASGTCPSIPAARSSFTSADSEVWFDFIYAGGSAGDAFVVQWFKPDGSLYLSNSYTQKTTGGSTCDSYYIAIAGYTPADVLGNWNVSLNWNGTTIATVPFSIGPASNTLITTIAGTIGVFPPTPLPASNAPLETSYGVATDSTGNVYVTDHDNNMIFRSTPGGALVAIGGNEASGSPGEGGPGHRPRFRGRAAWRWMHRGTFTLRMPTIIACAASHPPAW